VNRNILIYTSRGVRTNHSVDATALRKNDILESYGALSAGQALSSDSTRAIRERRMEFGILNLLDDVSSASHARHSCSPCAKWPRTLVMRASPRKYALRREQTVCRLDRVAARISCSSRVPRRLSPRRLPPDSSPDQAMSSAQLRA